MLAAYCYVPSLVVAARRLDLDLDLCFAHQLASFADWLTDKTTSLLHMASCLSWRLPLMPVVWLSNAKQQG